MKRLHVAALVLLTNCGQSQGSDVQSPAVDGGAELAIDGGTDGAPDAGLDGATPDARDATTGTDSTGLDADASALDGPALDGPALDGPALVDGGADAAADAPCNTLELSGPVVSEVVVPDPTPVGDGGVIVNGTYQLSAITAYNGYPATEMPRQETRTFVDGVSTYVARNGAMPLEHLNETYSTSGNVFMMMRVCPNSYMELYDSFDADPMHVTIYSSFVGKSRSYTRVP
jgi:hypothetical protein